MNSPARPGTPQFFGREAELAALVEWARRPGPSLAWVSGPGGIGKTTLLREFRLRIERVDGAMAVVSVDRINPSPASVLEAAAAALRLAEVPADLRSFLAGGRLLVLDAMEQATWLEAWLLDELASAPGSTGRVLVGSRDAPSHGWLSPHLAGRFLALELGPFSPDECAAFLAAHDVDAAQRPQLGAFTRGHPLALAVLVHAQARSFSTEAPGERPDLLRIILDATIDRSLDAAQRATLEAAAMVPALNEPTLCALLDNPDSHALLSWLQTRPYVVATPSGLRLHDLVRDVVAAELRWRNPERASLLSARAFDRFSGQLLLSSPETQRRAAESLVWMAQHHPGAASLFVSSQRDLYVDLMRDEDLPAVVALVERVDGPAGRALWEDISPLRPRAASVARNAAHEVRGLWFDLLLRRDEVPSWGHDPALRAIDRVLSALGVSPQAVLSVQRIHLDAATQRDPGPTMSLSTAIELRALVTVPRLQFRFFVAPSDTPWAPRWEPLGYVRCAGSEFSLGGRSFASWMLDFRERSPVAFLRAIFMASSFAALDPAAPARPPPEPWDEAAFRADVRAALQALADPALLASCALMSAPFLPDGPVPERRKALADLLLREIDGLGATSRGQKQRRALVATYLEAPASQEEVAERLGLPFRTYRDHLTRGLDEISRRLGAYARGAR